MCKLRRGPPERKFLTCWCTERPCLVSSVDTQYLGGNFRMNRSSDVVIVRCLGGELCAVGGDISHTAGHRKLVHSFHSHP